MRKVYILRYMFLSIIGVLPMMGWGQTFKHYAGHANNSDDYEVIDASQGCLRQKTHEYEYTIAMPEGGSLELPLPIVNYMNNGGDLEPRGYFRWYNYDTDKASDNLKQTSQYNCLLTTLSDGNNINKGLFAYNISMNYYANHTTVGVTYTRPSDANWKGENIACDVSRYVDGCQGTFQHEPTLSVRYIFHIIPAKQLADEIKGKLLETGTGRDYSYEDEKDITVGLKDKAATMTLRLNFNDIGNYYFHPMSNINTHHVFATDDAHKIQASDFSDEVVQANAIQWRVYNSDKSQYVWWTYKAGSSTPRFFDISLDLLNNTGVGAWQDLNFKKVSSKQTFKYGDRIYVVAIAENTQTEQFCPISNFSCQVMNHYPMTVDELKAANENTRLVSYLDEHYRSVATVSFDHDDDEQTLLAPTNANDNQDRLPSKWSKRSYGFVYRDLINQSAGGTSVNKWANPRHSPLHGEYGLYKTANVRGWSGHGSDGGTSGLDNYLWFSTNTLYDRTYESTNGAQYGHFLYIDAADESRQIAEADFKADLCVGSQVIFSSAIADMTSGPEQPQVLFKLYGVHYDENNEETERHLLHSFSTGSFKNNRASLSTGKWYQGYGKMVLQKESGVNNYTDFKIVVDNFCKSTSGADYAFDDLRIYTKASKVDVLQSAPICPDVDINQGTPTYIKLKVRALQETMAALADHQDKKLYFRFVDANGKPTTTVNYGTAAQPEYKWGSTTIHSSIDEGETMDGAKMYEKVNDEWYVNIANRNFNLDPKQTYYLSFAFDDESVEDKNLLSWGKPSDVCSIYSENFKMLQQTVVVTDANGNIATSVTIPCEKGAAPQYQIKAQLQTVDQNNGGSVNLQSIKFNWYIDNTHGDPVVRNSSEFKNIPLTEGEHTIYVEPTTGSATVTEGGVNYEICLGMMSFKLRAVKNGPKLEFGFTDVTYPKDYTRTIRLGLPQVKAMAQQAKVDGKKGFLRIPVCGKTFIADNSANLLFVKYNGDKTPFSTIYLSGTNDPTYQNRLGEGLKLAELESTTLARNATQLGLKFMPQVDETQTSGTDVQLHEGYWYEGILVFNEDGSKGTTVLCSGETYVRFEIVPEYATWNPTANQNMSAAWNNDQNWIRSTRSELYKSEADYTDYVGSSTSTSVANSASGTNSTSAANANEVAIDRMNAYVPMKFTKVVIPNLSGLYFPDLGYIAYQKSNGIATKLSNAKGDVATTNIQYAILAKWDATDTTNHGLNVDGNLECEKFYGNTCDQIYFKPGGELLDQCYLIYNKAWVEKELKPNTWYALSSPLKDVYAGDMYVPKASNRQETEAFEPISFSEQNNNRVTSPFYQRSWDDTSAEEIKLSELGTEASHKAYDYSGTGISFADQDLKAVSANWSHVYNKVDKEYSPMEGFALKMGDKYTVSSDTPTALLRLPKADTKYTYYNREQSTVNGGDSQSGSTSSGSTITATLNKENAYRLVVDEDKQESALGKMSQSLSKLSDGNVYYLVGNPYMATLSMYKFIKANPALSPTIYVYENGALKLYDKLDMSTQSYESKNDVTIAPMQSFFVKLADGQTASSLNFTSAMTVDREVLGGVKTQAAEDEAQSRLLTMRVSDGSNSSEARVVVNAEATPDYDSSEDAPLLYDENLKDVPMLYTVADDQAVAVNTMPSIDWLPLGVISNGASSSSANVLGSNKADASSTTKLSLKLKGLAKLSAPLYLYDAESKQYRELKDDEAVEIAANEHGRYFLTTTRGATGIEAATMDENAVKVYSPVSGTLVVSSPAPILNKVEVFTVDGKLVATRQLQEANTVSIPVEASAVYIVKVTVRLDSNQYSNENDKVLTRKLSIR